MFTIAAYSKELNKSEMYRKLDAKTARGRRRWENNIKDLHGTTDIKWGLHSTVSEWHPIVDYLKCGLSNYQLFKKGCTMNLTI